MQAECTSLNYWGLKQYMDGWPKYIEDIEPRRSAGPPSQQTVTVVFASQLLDSPSSNYAPDHTGDTQSCCSYAPVELVNK